MKEKKENSTAMDVFTVIAILLIIGIPVYGYFKLKPDRIFNMASNIKEEDDANSKKEDLPEEEYTEEDFVITGYTEELVEIDGQWSYISAPEPINPNDLPILIIYNHGSTTFVEKNLDADFRADLTQYAEALTPYNYIFAVSNAHGINWGSSDSVNDNYSMYEYIKNEYYIKEKVYMIGFSMGGLPTMNFATTYPELPSKVALLAPTTRTSEWSQDRVDKIKDIDIKIWHGTADSNVGYIYTKNFVNKIESLGKEIQLVSLENKTHWDVDTEYIDEIVDFFNSSQTLSE